MRQMARTIDSASAHEKCLMQQRARPDGISVDQHKLSFATPRTYKNSLPFEIGSQIRLLKQAKMRIEISTSLSL